MTALQQRASAILRRLEGVTSPRVAEIGVMDGKLSGALLRDRGDIRLTMVDNWAPEEGQHETYKATGDVNARLDAERVARHEAKVRALFEENIGRCQMLKSDSVAAAVWFNDGTFDLVFLDADHSYEGVKRDIEAWLPKAKTWIGGHDYRNPDPRFDFSGVERAVDEVFGDRVELDSNLTWWASL